LGLAVGIIVVLGAGSTQGPVFYDMPAPELGIAVDKNFVVVDVLVSSPAEKAGVQRGDVLKKVGKQNMTVPSAMKQLTEIEINSVTGDTTNSSGVMTLQAQALSIVVGRRAKQVILSLTPASPPFNVVGIAKLSKPLPTPTAAPEGLTYL